MAKKKFKVIIEIYSQGWKMKFFHQDITVESCDGVYFPREDSEMFADFIEELDLVGKRALDVGCGTGILSVVMAKKGAHVVSTDINERAVECTLKNAKTNGIAVNAVLTDVFDGLGSFDVIVFNSPYLPPGDENDIMWTNEHAIEKFLTGVGEHLKKGGRAYILVSSLTRVQPTGRVVRTKKLDFEELKIVEISKI